MSLARRQFLQSIVAGFVGSQICIDQLADQMAWAADSYAQNLAKTTRRKLALLVGINQYEARNEYALKDLNYRNRKGRLQMKGFECHEC